MRRALWTLWTVLVLGAGLLCGCRRSPEAQLVAREWSTWMLPAEGGSLPTARSLATGADDSLATLDTAGRVSIYGADGVLRRQWKMLDVSVGKPEGIVMLADGRLVVCDTHYHRLVWFDAHGNWLSQTGRRGEGPGEFIYPVGICKDAQENLYVCEYGGHDRIQKFTRDGKWLLSFGSFGTGPGQFQRPSGLAWRGGQLFIADAINNRVLIYSDSGQYIGLLGAGGQPLAFELPYDITLGGDGLLYVIEYGGGRLSQVTPEGQLRGRFGHSGSGEGQFATPWGITVDSKMRFFIADTKNRRIVRLRF